MFDKIEEFVAGALVTKEDTAEGRCGSYRIGLLHTTKGHACVRRFNDDGDSERLESFLDAVTDLRGEPFLNLKTTGESFHDASDLAEAGDRSVRDISDVGLADERHDMMFACRIKLDILYKDHLLIFFLEHCATKDL